MNRPVIRCLQDGSIIYFNPHFLFSTRWFHEIKSRPIRHPHNFKIFLVWGTVNRSLKIEPTKGGSRGISCNLRHQAYTPPDDPRGTLSVRALIRLHARRRGSRILSPPPLQHAAFHGNYVQGLEEGMTVTCPLLGDATTTGRRWWWWWLVLPESDEDSRQHHAIRWCGGHDTMKKHRMMG